MPDLQCVVHVHPLSVVLFTICNKPLQPLYGAYDPSGLRLLVDGLATYPRSVTVSDESLARNSHRRWETSERALCAGTELPAPVRAWKERPWPPLN